MSKITRIVGISLLFATLVAAPGTAQDTAVVADLDLDAIFSSDRFAAEPFGPARWLDGSRYATLEPSRRRTDGVDLLAYDAATGTREVLVSANDLVPARRPTPIDIEDYAFSPDGNLLLLYTESRRVWRSNSRGDYWVFDLRDRGLTRVGSGTRPSSLMFAKFSPDSSRVAYVMDNDLYVQDLRNGVTTRLTHDGSETIVNGTFDWVYEEELGLADGFRWSPDGEHIAFWQLDSSLVREYTLVNTTDELYPVFTTFPYPKAGEINSAARIGVISAGGGETVWADFEGSPRDNYLARMEWASERELIVQRVNRRQNRNRVTRVDVRNGRPREVLRETDAAWVDVRDDLHWLDDGERFTWVSERDGWRRVYTVPRDGGDPVAVSPAGVDILSVELVDDAGGWVYFIASPDDPTQRYLYRSSLRDSSRTERISPLDAPGTHSYQIAPGGAWAIHTFHGFATPPATDVVSLPEHATVRVLAGNEALRSRVAALGIDHEFFRVRVDDEVELDGWAMFPPDFDPAARYPVLFYVYGEPWGQTVLDSWGGDTKLWHHYLTRLGYIVMSVDNRGTPAPRGRAWRKVVYGEVGTLAAADQAAAVRQIVADRPYVDPARVAIWGWSGGGSMTLNALFRHPDVYATGMSVAPVPDQRYYDTIYQERYMGTPQDNPDGYRRGSPITYAANLEGNLLLIHGTGDDNVHYQGTEALINRLVEHGKHFTMMAYPNRSHGIFEGPGTTRHVYGLLTRYLLENLPARVH